MSVVIRKRNHRKNSCGTCQGVTIAYYILTQNISDSEKLELCSNHPNLIDIDRVFYDRRFVFLFSDGSIIGYQPETSFYVTDTWLRKGMGKRPSKSGEHKRKKVFV